MINQFFRLFTWSCSIKEFFLSFESEMITAWRSICLRVVCFCVNALQFFWDITEVLCQWGNRTRHECWWWYVSRLCTVAMHLACLDVITDQYSEEIAGHLCKCLNCGRNKKKWKRNLVLESIRNTTFDKKEQVFFSSNVVYHATFNGHEE